MAWNIKKQLEMSGIDFLADTNILLYILEDLPQIEEISNHTFGVSVISEIELLGKKEIASNDIKIIKDLLQDCVLLPFTEQTKEKTIELKQKYSIKIPDAIIAATSILNNIPLVTADKGFSRIPELKLQLIEL